MAEAAVTDPVASALDTLTAPGGAFEIVEEEVRGVRVQVFKERLRSFREVFATAYGRASETWIVFGDRRITFGEFADAANSVSRVLRRGHGVSSGDRVAVLSANNPEWCLAFWGAVNIGAICVGLNGWWKDDEILYGLKDSGAKILVADRSRYTRVAAALDEIPSVEKVFLVDADPGDFGGGPRLHAFGELVAEPTPDTPDVPIGEDDPAVIFYTSATTGRPKGVTTTHRSWIASMHSVVAYLFAAAMSDPEAAAAATGRRTGLLTLPLFHVGGCQSSMFIGLFAGRALVIPEGRVTAEACLELIEREKVTDFSAVPTIIWRVCTHPERHRYDLSSVTAVSYGGAPPPLQLQEMVRETFPGAQRPAQVWGLTESSSMITLCAGEDFRTRPASTGRPLPTVELEICDPDGKQLAAGRTGEIVVRGPMIVPGYWGKPEATADTFTSDGWLHTGDVGYVDEDGFLYVTDRAKDIIIRGGENISSVEIEQRLVAHPEIHDAAVIGVPHPELGEEVKAVVQLVEGSTLTQPDIQRWVAETLADFKVPAHVEIRTDPLPRNAAGKLLKNAFRGAETSFAETL